MKHLKLNLLEGSNLIGTPGHDEFICRTTTVISGFDPAQDKVVIDSSTGVYDGNWAGFKTTNGFLSDGLTFDNSHHTASLTVHAGDYNGDGITDTILDVSGAFDFSVVLLGIDPGAIPGADIFGG